MATRADFYVGCGPSAKWLGSIAFDGYQWAEDDHCALRQAKTVDDYVTAVNDILHSNARDDQTLPRDGWPWPWNDSSTTDYAYYFDGETKFDDRDDWPDMSAIKNLAMGTKRDSIMIFGVKS